MNDWLDRTRLLLGEEKLARLERAHVLVVGLGGVGAYAAEQLCRAGIGEMTVIDGDVVEPTNKNRQLLALDGNMGLPKAEVMASRLRSINPALRLHVLDEFVRDDRMLSILRAAAYDYVVDAIDTLAPKIFLIYHSLQLGLPVVSSMGSGGKLDPSKIQVADISKSYNCALARMLRKRLHKLGVYKGAKQKIQRRHHLLYACPLRMPCRLRRHPRPPGKFRCCWVIPAFCNYLV